MRSPQADSPSPSHPDTNRPGSGLTQGVWRYLYNRVGDLVAVRDPRGSGQNFFYDRAGRLLGESYAYSSDTDRPPHQNVELLPRGSVALDLIDGLTMVQVRNFYDEPPPWAANRVPGGQAYGKGRATGTSDRGQRTAVAYDPRGNTVWSARQLALLEAASTLAPRVVNGAPVAQTGRLPDYAETLTPVAAIAYDERHTYEITQLYDHAGRVVTSQLPSDPDFVGGTPPRVGGRLTYNRHGAPDAASLTIDGSSYPVVHRTSYTRDGLVSRTLYGDDIITKRVRTDTRYDDRRRPLSTRTVRTRTPGAAPLTLGYVQTLVAQDFHWDPASNLLGIDDLRPPTEWPEGHAPQSVRVRHDALYRVAGVEYTYAGGTSDAASDWRDAANAHREADPMRAQPAPMLPQGASGLGRVVDISYEHDWLANMTSFHDDAELFYERSIGDIVNGQNESVTTTSSEARPSALYLAENVSSGAPDGHRGWLETTYHAGGNLATMTVHARCRDRSATVRCTSTRTTLVDRRNDLRNRCTCDAEQHYVYKYDELNRVSEARRFDREAGSWALKVRQRYRYDAANQRTLKQTIDVETDDSRVALYVFPGDYERRGLRVGVDSYEAIPGETETQYLVAGARVVWQDRAGLMPGIDADHRITIGLADLIQSTSAVIDLMSGEPLEVTGFYPNGAREHYLTSSDPASLEVPLEPIGFTGKEAEEEVGLVYFGERYLVPRIGRWATPDPLHIHASGGGEELNSYHYVSGNLLQARDPLGLDANVAVRDAPDGGLEATFQAEYVIAAGDPNQRDRILQEATAAAERWNHHQQVVDVDGERVTVRFELKVRLATAEEMEAIGSPQAANGQPTNNEIVNHFTDAARRLGPGVNIIHDHARYATDDDPLGTRHFAFGASIGAESELAAPRADVMAHEMGHTLGLVDRYFDSRRDRATIAASGGSRNELGFDRALMAHNGSETTNATQGKFLAGVVRSVLEAPDSKAFPGYGLSRTHAESRAIDGHSASPTVFQSVGRGPMFDYWIKARNLGVPFSGH